MATPTTLTLTGQQHEEAKSTLYPGDGNEAVVLALCGPHIAANRTRLLVRKLVRVPHEACAERRADRVTWSTNLLPPLLEEAAGEGLSLLKVHSHPSGFAAFSSYDDAADRDLFPSAYGWTDSGPHASAIMLPDGRLIGRVVDEEGHFHPLQAINVVGDDLRYWTDGIDPAVATDVPDHAERIVQTFGKRTYATLGSLKVGVVGCSGTGSPVVEQLARNGVGALILVDHDQVERKNLNRILNATMDDADRGTPKVEVLARAVAAMDLGTDVTVFADSLWNPAVLRTLADCDVVFGCMDSIDGRHLLNRLATFYLLAYFDLGVKIEADGRGGVDQACGTVHYLQPGRSSLMSRGVYTLEEFRSAALRSMDPNAFAEQQRAGYITGAAEDRPAVISLNMLTASIAVNEFLARLHGFRQAPSRDFATHRFSLTHGFFVQEPEEGACQLLVPHVGRGDVEPLLDMPTLDDLRKVAA